MARPALTGWEPPSALLSPANEAAMAYLQGIARAFAALAVAAGQPVRFQVGEPWWWVTGGRAGSACTTTRRWRRSIRSRSRTCAAPLDAAQQATLDEAGAALAASTAALCAAVRDEAPDAECLLLVYLPTVLDGAEVKRANVPLGWAAPAFDVLQLEDYDWVTAGRTGATARAVAGMADRLGYPVAEQHYFAGFVLAAEDRHLWARIAAAAEASAKRGTAETFVWALPQVLRDGFVHFDLRKLGQEEDEMEAFADRALSGRARAGRSAWSRLFRPRSRPRPAAPSSAMPTGPTRG